jgi:multisubunit Na+/H+ antiporter MnhF subunit
MGSSLGAIMFWLWRLTPGQVLAFNVLFYFATTFSQQIYRIIEGPGTWDELIYITALRVIFASAAVSTAWLLLRVEEE